MRICGDHLGGKKLAAMIIRQVFFWPSIREDCEEFMKKCTSCKLNAYVNHKLSEELAPILSPCPFFMWGIDVMGPFLKVRIQLPFLLVAIDYTTKWVEAKLVAHIREKEMIEFFINFVVFRFGVPIL